MNIVIGLCLVYMIGLAAWFIIRLVTLPRKDRIKYVKNFKRGKFVLIYFAAAPLYFLAYRFNGVSIDNSFWNTLTSCLEIVVLKYDYATVAPLMAESLFYHIAVELIFVLVTLNALMFALSFGGQVSLNTISLWFTRHFRKRIVVVVGYNSNSLDIIKSVKKDIGKAVLIDKLSPELRDDAYAYRADCVNLSQEDFGDKIKKLFGSFNKKTVSVILNCEDDAASLLYVKQLWLMMQEAGLTNLPLTEPYGLRVYVFGEKENEITFEQYEEESMGLIRFINRHMQIAMNFINEYPMTKYMTDDQIDKKTATIKENIELNVFMVGFGKLNETLFLTSVSNNQFLTVKDGRLQPKTVHYHIYDRHYPEGIITEEEKSIHSRSLHHGYMRYSKFLNENKANQAQYLEFVPPPAELHICPYEITHPDFYNPLRTELEKKNSYTYIIISFGADIENIELAEKLQQKVREWKVSSFVKIFVKVRDEKIWKKLGKDFENGCIKFFGSNQNYVYNAPKILNEELEMMAKRRHILYTEESEKKKGNNLSEEGLERRARIKWYIESKQFQRESNIFACMSLRMKLNLLGYDYDKAGEDVSSHFESTYEDKDYAKSPPAKVDEKTIRNYTNAEQGKESIRWTFAVLEHQRWCANMICHGLVPSSRKEIEENGGKLLEKRQHGNLTTMDGLKEYRKIVAKKRGSDEETEDVIRYDYQLMDEVVWLLHKCGYKLIHKKNS